ncbi:MAG: pilus assembly protein TadG-related protein [Lacisediminihabitans sp.]
MTRPISVNRMRDDEGSILPLTIFYGFLSLVLILLVVAATSLYIERKRLFTIADGAALVGAEAFQLDAVTQTASGLRPTLKSADVAAAVTDYLAASPHDDFESLRIDRAETVDGRSATVALSAHWRPPIVSLLVPDGFRIDVTALARSVFY